MRSKSRFTTLVLLETRESYLQIRVQSLCTLRGHCRQGPRNIRYQASGATPYSDRSSTGWIAPACLAHSFDHLVGAGEQRLRGGDAWPFCAVVEPGEDTRTLSTSSKCHLRVRRFIEPSHRVLRRIPQFPPWGAQRPVGIIRVVLTVVSHFQSTPVSGHS